MSNEAQVKKLTDVMAQFVGFTAKKLPDDVIAKLQELRGKEDTPMTKASMIPCSVTRNWLWKWIVLPVRTLGYYSSG